MHDFLINSNRPTSIYYWGLQGDIIVPGLIATDISFAFYSVCISSKWN